MLCLKVLFRINYQNAEDVLYISPFFIIKYLTYMENLKKHSNILFRAGKLLLLFLLLLPLTLYGKSKKLGHETIGVTKRMFFDSTRSNWLGTGPRPIRVLIWYPSNSGGVKEKDQNGGSLITLLRNGKISHRSARYPLIIISHGATQHASSMYWLGSFLALHDYIAAAVDHNGTPKEERQVGGPLTLTDFCLWERPKDLSIALNYILADPVLGKRINNNSIGAAGFSAGGATVIWTAGARLNLDSLEKYGDPPPPQMVKQVNEYIKLSKTDKIVKESFSRAGNSYKDKRIKAVFALAPAIGAGFTKKGLSSVNVPVMIIVGKKDLVAPPAKNADRYARYIANSKLITLPGEAGHFIMEKSKSEQDKIMEHVCKLALDFFNRTLKH